MKLHYAFIVLLSVMVAPHTMGIQESKMVDRGGKFFRGTEKCGKKSKNGSKFNWSPCFEKFVQENFPDVHVDVEFECTDFDVPLDYDNGYCGGNMIQLSLVRRLATDTENRLGSLLINPGGPGASGVDFALYLGALGSEFLGPVLDQYDIVGFDPRGIARSTPLRCFNTTDEAYATMPESAFPFTEDEISEFEACDTNLNDQCNNRSGNEIISHMSTTNVARDMDMIREALGETKLNYFGFSYGTALGMYYANMYPDNVGAFVIDGNIDPITWTNLDCQVTNGNAMHSDQGAQDTLVEFILQCNEAQSENCPLAPHAGKRLDAVLENLKTETDPITLFFDGDPFILNYANVISLTLYLLYSPLSFLTLAKLFVELEAPNPDPEAIVDVLEDGRLLQPALKRHLRTSYDNTWEANTAVLCSDSCNPTDYQADFEDGKDATEHHGYFGEIWNWAGSSTCASWTATDADRYTGPFDAVTSTPVLVVNNLYDPATRYQDAVMNNAHLQNSRLLTVDTPGHCSIDSNECADSHISEYLADPAAYAESHGNSVCKKERNFLDYLAAPKDKSKKVGEFQKKIMEHFSRFPF